MIWKKSLSLEDLKKEGDFEEVKSKVNRRLPEGLCVCSDDWGGLFDSIEKIRDHYPFLSEESKYIYALTESDGKERAELLGIEKEHYREEGKENAKSRKRYIQSIIHPDKCEHPKAREASQKLNKIFEQVL